MARLSTPGPDIGTFDTDEVPHEKPESYYERRIAWNPGQYDIPPNFALGFSHFDASPNSSNETNYFGVELAASTAGSALNEPWFNVQVTQLGHRLINKCTMHWVEFRKQVQDVQTGYFRAQRTGRQSQRITFKRPFEDPPFILVWFRSMRITAQQRWRARAWASDIDTEGFACSIDCPENVGLIDADWIAIKQPKKTIEVGIIGSHNDFGKEKKEQKGHQAFPAGKFKAPPSVIGCFNMIDMPLSNTKVSFETSNVTNSGFDWELKRPDDHAHGVMWIALSNDLTHGP